MTAQAKADLQIDNDRTRVTRWTFPPGAATGFHRHEYDYVIVPLVDGKVKIVGKDGAESFADMTAGESYFREAGVEHDVISANDFTFAFVEIEFK